MERCRLFEFVNSNFSITVIGGLILWGVSAYWQDHVDMRRDLERKNQVINDRQVETIERFSVSFIYKLSLLREYKTREAWLIKNKNKNNKADIFYRDGRSFKETVIKYEQSLDKYLKQPSIFSLKAQIKASFSDCSILPYLPNIISNMEFIISAESSDTHSKIQLSLPKIEENYEVLLENMINESTGREKKCLE
ncbi:MAG: hypothetical protein ACI9LM_004947 [Alteromonadaceae bacterium]|jgi:hypothetical protein